MKTLNPFKELESEAVCPPHLKAELVSEIDLIRNTLLVVELYVDALVGIATGLIDQPYQTTDKTTFL